MTELVEGSKRLLAYNIEAEKIIPTLNALGNIAAGVGRDKLPQLILAFGQVRAAGKLTGAELRQFTEAGVPLLDELGKVMGKTAGQVKEDMEGGMAPSFDQVNQALTNLSGEGGRFHNLMQKQSETTAGKWSNLLDKLQMTSMEIGAKLLPAVNDLMASLSKGLDSFNKLDPAVQQAIVAFAGFAVAVGPVLMVIGNLIKFAGLIGQAWGFLAPLFAAVGAAIGALSLPVLIIIGIIAALIAAGVMLWQHWDVVKQKAGELWAWLGQVWSGIKDSIVNAVTATGALLATTWETITAGIATFITSATEWFRMLPENIAYWLGWLVGRWIRFLTTDLPNFIMGVQNWFSQLPGIVGLWLMNTYNSLVLWFTNMGTAAISIISNAITSVSNWFQALPGRIAGAVSAAWGAVVNGFNSMRSAMIGAIADAINSVVGWFSSLPGRVWNAISGMAGQLYNRAKEIGGKFWQGIKDGLGIHSPSYVERAFMAISAQADQTTRDMRAAVGELNRMPSNVAAPAGQVDISGSTGRPAGVDPITSVAGPGSTTASNGGVHFHLHVGNYLGNPSEERGFAVKMAQLASQAVKAQGVDDVDMVRT